MKLHGYRIELEAIESHLAQCDGVEMAACKVQETRAEQQLVAFVVLANERPLDGERLQEELRRKLPPSMVPAHFAVLGALPVNVSGKLDRKALPNIEIRIQRGCEMVTPRNSLEARIAQAICAYLPGMDEISVHDNFFALGGTSITAAQVISALRCHPDTTALTVRDLYDAPTVAGLAEKLGGQPEPSSDLGERKRLSPGWPRLSTTLQVGTLLLGILVSSILGYVGTFHIMAYFLNLFDLVTATLLLPVIALVAMGLYIPISLGIALLGKKLLIGKYKPGRHPVWGWFFFRNWLMQGLIKTIPWSLVEGTCLKNWFLRKLGAKIGKNVHIHKGVTFPAAGYDLLEIGDNVTLSHDVMLRMVTYQDQEIVLGPISIGDNCTLETRSGMSPFSRMEPNSYLTAFSLVPSHASIPEGKQWEGIPAQYQGPTPQVPPCTEKPWSEVKHACMALLGNTIVAHPPREAMRLFEAQQVDAYITSPPFAQELRAKHIGQVVVNSSVDHPWSQYFCCVVAGHQEFVRKHPVATKRALRAILKGANICALEPERAARALVNNGLAPRYDYALQTMQDVPYGRWREYDPEDTVRFYALRLHEVGMLKSTPQKLIAQGTDWRFLKELKRELKG